MIRLALLSLFIMISAPVLAQYDDDGGYEVEYEYEYEDRHEDYDTGLSYKGYDCTVDCSGHKAGYEWAERKGIADEDDCGGSSNSFIEGCRSFVEENY